MAEEQADDRAERIYDLAERSVKEALSWAEIDPLLLLRTPWDALHDVVGPIWPNDLWYVGAASGNGKTSVLAHLIEWWIAQQRRVYVISLEQKQSELRRALAALALGLHTTRVLENDWARLRPGAEQDLRGELKRAMLIDRERLVFSDRVRMRVEDVAAEFAMAAHLDADVIVLDHLHRVDVNGYPGLVKLCDVMDTLTNEFGIPMVNAVQFNRGEKDPLQPFRRPSIYDIQGGEVIRQSSSVTLGLFRPCQPMTADDVRQVRQGTLAIRDFLKPHTMGVAVMKHRKRGDTVTLPAVELEYKNGRIRDRVTEDRGTLEARYGL